MNKYLIATISALLLTCTAPIAASAAAFNQEEYSPYSIEDFTANSGDYMVAHLEEGIGYLVNDEKRHYASFPLLSGQKRYIRYLGRGYFAATPEQTWVVKEKNIQGDRVTFGKTGEFLRLFANGKRTHYGIHGHRSYDVMIARETKFQSYGCIIVSDFVLDVIEKSFLENGGELMVITTNDLSEVE